MTNSVAEEPLGRFLEMVGSPEADPGGGSVAAVAAALAAALVSLTARLSTRQVDDVPAIVARADHLLRKGLLLAKEDATAYAGVRAACALPREPDPERRREQVNRALEQASEVPLEIMQAAAEVAVLAAQLARYGNANLEGDAVTAFLLARAAAQSSATLVELNVRAGELEGDWLDRSAVHLAIVREASPERAADTRG